MDRSADYTIQGFIYQFNKTLLEILKHDDDAVICVEGIAEDIEVWTNTGGYAIQCKYHEAVEKFTLSIVYKPILQMMKHFCDNQDKHIKYILYGYFPSATQKDSTITPSDIRKIIATTNVNLQAMATSIKDKIDINRFLDAFTFEIGEKLDAISNSVCVELVRNAYPAADVEFIGYPNAIHYISLLSTKHDPLQRITTKNTLLNKLKDIRKTVITKWTRAATNARKLLELTRKQLKINLDKNSRARCFVFSKKSVAIIHENVAQFVKDYVDKYNFKHVHNKTPIFCFECDVETMQNIATRIHNKGISLHDGMVYCAFNFNKFSITPILKKGKTSHDFQRQFAVKICRLQDIHDNLGSLDIDDLFLFGDIKTSTIQDIDTNLESIYISNINELRYLLGVGNARID